MAIRNPINVKSGTFNNARGEASALQMKPPFAFSDVKMMVFPLQANLARLSQFCDSYLNQAGNIVQFKPFLPFVYLIILDYGRMSAPATQTGWVSQREVAFGVPLKWLKATGQGEMAFHDFAFTTPFIFVDNELSLSTGREVYGWPKLLARLDPRIDEWVKDPHGARKVFEIRSRAAADRAGDDLRAPFLSVTQTPLTGLMDFPPNLKSAAQAAVAWPNAIAGAARMMRDASAALGGIALEKMRKADRLSDLILPENMRSLLAPGNSRQLLQAKGWAEIADGVRGLFPKLCSNTINFKQFRDTENPMETCYQAITAASMPIERVGRGGFLGTQNLMMGQIDGGYRVNIINTSTVPIVSHLGLVEAGQQEVDGGVMSSFAPVCPFWIELDMVYDLGETVAMRTRSGDWRRPDEDEAQADPASELYFLSDQSPSSTFTEPSAAAPSNEADEPGYGADDAAVKAASALSQLSDALSDIDSLCSDYSMIEATNPFNTTRGASEALGGVFRMKDGRVRVLPLLADTEVLSKFVENYIQVPGHMKVSLWGRYVYMISTQYESITADLLPGKKASACEVTFAVPVKCYDAAPDHDLDGAFADSPETPDEELWQRGARELVGTAIVTPFNYVDDITTAITESEVFGVPTLRSEIVSVPEGWAADPQDAGNLLQVNAIVVPSLGSAAEGKRKTLLDVRAAPIMADDSHEEWKRLSPHWGKLLSEDLLVKSIETGHSALGRNYVGFDWGRAMALRILGGLHGVDTLSLKQFRDASTPEDACYQGVVVRGTSIERLHSLEEIEGDLTVSITRYPTQPIAETLGLIPKRTVVADEGVCDEFEPLRPFELRADLISSKGRTLYERAGKSDWKLINLPQGPLGWRPSSANQVDDAKEAEREEFTPEPKISYVRYDPQSDRHSRLKPLLLNEPVHKAFLQDVSQSYARDTLMLWRGVTLGALADQSVFDAMDDHKVDDIHTFVRTRQPVADNEKEKEAKDKVYSLAGSLEFITPATILDSLLSRRWGSRKPRKPPKHIHPQYFRVRRNTLGPKLAEQLFPERESQDGYWPMSSEFAFDTCLREAMTENSLPHEFRKFLDLATQYHPDLEGVKAAEEALPEWFRRAAFDRVPVIDQIFEELSEKENLTYMRYPAKIEDIQHLKLSISLMGVWSSAYKEELRDKMDDFFSVVTAPESRENHALPWDMFSRSWRRMAGELVAEAMPDIFADFDDTELLAFQIFVEHKTKPRTPGWLRARLEMIAEEEEYSASRLTSEAVVWETRIAHSQRP